MNRSTRGVEIFPYLRLRSLVVVLETDKTDCVLIGQGGGGREKPRLNNSTAIVMACSDRQCRSGVGDVAVEQSRYKIAANIFSLIRFYTFLSRYLLCFCVDYCHQHAAAYTALRHKGANSRGLLANSRTTTTRTIQKNHRASFR